MGTSGCLEALLGPVSLARGVAAGVGGREGVGCGEPLGLDVGQRKVVDDRPRVGVRGRVRVRVSPKRKVVDDRPSEGVGVRVRVSRKRKVVDDRPKIGVRGR